MFYFSFLVNWFGDENIQDKFSMFIIYQTFSIKDHGKRKKGQVAAINIRINGDCDYIGQCSIWDVFFTL